MMDPEFLLSPIVIDDMHIVLRDRIYRRQRDMR